MPQKATSKLENEDINEARHRRRFFQEAMFEQLMFMKSHRAKFLRYSKVIKKLSIDIEKVSWVQYQEITLKFK